MKRVTPLPFDDDTALKNMAINKRLDVFPILKNNHKKILAAYKEYSKKKGRASKINPIQVSTTLKSGLIKQYNSPCNEIKIIKEIRKKLSVNVCPMCGSFNTGTLDHLLPKDVFPEFAIYTINLVPACSCNTRRGAVYIGEKAGERILHPYFDEILMERLVTATFNGSPALPEIGVCVCYSGTQKKAASFHVEKIIKKTDIIEWLSFHWLNVLRDLDTYVPEIRKGIITRRDLRLALTQSLARCDREYGTPNNWKSIFFSGLLDSPLFIDFLLNITLEIRSGFKSPEDI